MKNQRICHQARVHDMAIKMLGFKIADQHTYAVGVKKTVNGRAMIKIASQQNPRLIAKKRTNYIYQLEGTNYIYYNRSRNGVVFIPMGYDDREMARYTDIFINPPLTQAEKEWLERNHYVCSPN